MRSEIPDRERELLERWLTAEQAAGEDFATGAAAEAALGVLFGALPALVPAPGLADRVLAAAGGGAAIAWWARVPSRLAAALVLLAGLAGSLLLVGLGPLAAPAASRLTLAGAIAGLTDGLVGAVAALGRWAGPSLDLLDTLLRLGGTLGRVAATTPVATALLAGLLLAGLALKVLHDVLEPDRSFSHASMR